MARMAAAPASASRNVRERLIARFGDRAGCLYGPDPDGGYTVHLYMPVVRE